MAHVQKFEFPNCFQGKNFLKTLIYFFGCFGSLLLHTGFSLVAASGGYFVAVCRLLSAVFSLVAGHGL